MTSTIDAAETTLPELLKQVEMGDTIILVAGTQKTPIATLKPVDSPSSHPSERAVSKGLDWSHVPGSVWLDPLPEEELRLWEDGGPNDPLNWSEERIRQVNAASDATWK